MGISLEIPKIWIEFSLDASPACPPNLRLLFAQCMSSALPNGREIRWHMVSQQYGRDGFSGPRAGPFDHCFFPEEQQDSAKAVRVFRAGSGKWRIEGNDFVQEIDSELPVFPENTPIPKMVIRRKIVDVGHDKIVFADASPLLREASLPPIAK